MIPKKSGERIKTDRRDAVKLAQNHRSGELVAVVIPDEASEAIRDLERARDDAKKAERVAAISWASFSCVMAGATPARRPGTTRIEPGSPRLRRAGTAACAGRRTGGRRNGNVAVAQLTERLRELAATWELGPLVKALKPLRGVEFVTAVTVVAEVGDFRRFAKATDFMGYVGLIPTEQTSGTCRRGPDHQDGQCPRASLAGRIGVALSEAASDEQGVARAERRDLAGGLRDRMEGTEAAA